MKTQAAVLVETKKPLAMAELEIPKLKPGQSLVEIAYSGICHTQVLECRGYRGEDKFLPHCLGHEGSGTVREVGAGVVKVKPGDNVILSWIKGSGAEVSATQYQWDGRVVNSGAITTFSRFSVISENRLTPIPQGVSLQHAALLGCSLPTGLGTVFNTAKPVPGQSLAVFGTGGIGMCAIMGASLAGCVPLIAVDIHEDKLELARKMGATHVINAGKTNPVEEIQKICPGGVDFAIEASGRPPVMQQALACVRHQGGTAVVIGNARFGEQVELDPRQLNMGKRLLGTWGGDNVPDRDYPRYLKLLMAGKLNMGPMVEKTYRLEEIDKAMDDLESGKVMRPILDMGIARR